MNRSRVTMFALVAVVGALAFLPRVAVPRCSYFARFPEAIGRHTFMLARATSRKVDTEVGPRYMLGRRIVPAQVMRVDRLAGQDADSIREALRASDGDAVFVRYHIGLGCGPYPALDGALDRSGTRGLYVGVPRPRTQWIGGRPTFDVFGAEHQPMPDRIERPRNSGHLVLSEERRGPTMSATELFDLYASLWSGSASMGDTTPWIRVREWIARNPKAARKHPAAQIADRVVLAVDETRLRGRPVALGGTFVLDVEAGGESTRLYGRTTTTPRVWNGGVTRDSATGIAVRAVASQFAVDVAVVRDTTHFAGPYSGLGVCVRIPVVVSRMPMDLSADSAWVGQTDPLHFAECTPEGSPLRRLRAAEYASERPVALYTVTVRKDSAERVSMEMRVMREGVPILTLRGERISEVTDGPPR